MAFEISITGEDSFDTDAHKSVFERHLVEEIAATVRRLEVKPSVTVSAASIETDTTGSVDLVTPSDG